jgi:hypothetical protein
VLLVLVSRTVRMVVAGHCVAKKETEARCSAGHHCHVSLGGGGLFVFLHCRRPTIQSCRRISSPGAASRISAAIEITADSRCRLERLSALSVSLGDRHSFLLDQNILFASLPLPPERDARPVLKVSPPPAFGTGTFWKAKRCTPDATRSPR